MIFSVKSFQIYLLLLSCLRFCPKL
uniref:Uncharacterized protein n=1 Tax=Arundo donax TaxID=35708 RepID=A0A0A9FJW5_ARUDO